MRETPNVRQIQGEPARRWFSSPELDLIVWLDRTGAPTSFELCYDKKHHERSITWSPHNGFNHMGVDDGEQCPGKYKATPVLVANGPFDASAVLAAFRAGSRHLPADITDFVQQALLQYPSPVPN